MNIGRESLSTDVAQRTSPLALSPEDTRWVERTRDALSVEAQIAQLFILSSRHDSVAETDELLVHAPGGIHRFPTRDLDAAWAAARDAVERLDEPLAR